MDDRQIRSELERLFAELPEITLPPELSAQRLFVRMDEAPQPQDSGTVGATGRVIAFVGRYRQVLSYAAAFMLLVLVYYGAGGSVGGVNFTVSDNGAVVSSSGAIAYDAANGMMDSAPRMAAPPSYAAPQGAAGEGAVTGSGMEESLESFDTAADTLSSAPMLMTAGVPEENLEFYRAVAEALPTTGADEKRTAVEHTLDSTVQKLGGNRRQMELTRSGDGYAVGLYGNADASLQTDYPLECAALEQSSLYLVERLEDTGYAEDVTISLFGDEPEERSSEAVRLSYYDAAENSEPMLNYTLVQEGRFVFAQSIETEQAESGLLLATVKTITADEGLMLADVAPCVGDYGEFLNRALDPVQVTSYPQAVGQQYLLITVMGLDGGNIVCETRAILGSNLIINKVSNDRVVVFCDAHDGAETVETLTMGGVTVELR